MRRLAILLGLCSTSVLAQTATTEPPVVEATMGDDSYIQVNLDFDFPLYGQLFNQSWMYDNGIISFLNPNDPMAVSPWQWSAYPINETPGNYFIAPLWADMAPTSITKYSYQGDSTFMKYTWSNIAEYYSAWDANPRYNTFSTTIKPDGSISTTYYSINLSTSNISAGVVGNSSLGQYDSKFYAPNGTSVTYIQDWTIEGSIIPTPPPPVPVLEPVIVNYVEDTQIIETTPVLEVISLAPKESSPEVVPTISTTVVVDISSPSSTDKKLVTVDAKSIARNNQAALSLLIESIVSQSVQGSQDSVALSQTDYFSQVSNITSTEQTSDNRGQTSTSYQVSQSNSYNYGETIGSDIQIDYSMGSDLGQDNTFSGYSNDIQKPITVDETNPISIRNLADMTTVRPQIVEEAEEQKTEESVDNIKDAAFAELTSTGVQLATLSVVPVGYFNYFNLVYKDKPFYPEKRIYRKQKVIDNLRVLRMLNARSDLNYEKLVNAQYLLSDLSKTSD